MGDNETLKPCPFCGSVAKSDNGFAPCESITYAFCTNSECGLGNELLFTPTEWNNRQPESSLL